MRGADGLVVTEPAAVGARIVEWMSGLHQESADDQRYSTAEFGLLQTEHARWESADRGAECDESLAAAADARRWEFFVARTDDGAAATDLEWSAYLVSDPTPREVIDAFELIDVGVAPSPGDGIVGRAIKLGGTQLAETFALLFAVAMRRGRAPAAWSTGFIKWIFKGKGNVLDPGAYRGVVLKSIVGQTFERVLLKRLLRWLRA